MKTQVAAIFPLDNRHVLLIADPQHEPIWIAFPFQEFRLKNLVLRRLDQTQGPSKSRKGNLSQLKGDFCFCGQPSGACLPVVGGARGRSGRSNRSDPLSLFSRQCMQKLANSAHTSHPCIHLRHDHNSITHFI